MRALPPQTWWRLDRSRTGLLALAALLLFSVGLGSHRALTDHEALLAGSTKEMVQSGDWLLLRIGDQPWLEKPPLPQWLAAVSALGWGTFSEGTMRLPFALCGVLVVLLVAGIMARLRNPTLGFLAGLVQATVVYQVSYARLAESDVVLQVFVLGAIAAFVHVERSCRERGLTDQLPTDLAWWRFAFWLLLGGTNLAKGLVFGTVLVGLTCAGWVLLEQQPRLMTVCHWLRQWMFSWGSVDRRHWRSQWHTTSPSPRSDALEPIGHVIRRWWSPSGMTLGLLIALAWPLAVAVRDPAALGLWLSHTVGRAAGSLGYIKPWWYYLTTWPTQLLPWTPILLWVAPWSLRRAWRRPHQTEAFLWWWLASHPLLLSLSSGKHHHYLLYALPAASGLIALGLWRIGVLIGDARRRWVGWQVTGGVVAVVAVVAAACVTVWRPEFTGPAWVIATLVLLLECGLIRSLRTHQARLAFGSLWLVIAAGHLYAQVAILPLRDPSAADKAFLAEVARIVAPEAPLAASGCQEIARHIFYLDRPVVGVWNPRDLGRHLPKTGDWYVIARGTAADELLTHGRVEQVLQSRYTRRETQPADRYTLFRIDRSTTLAESRIPPQH
jgi:4-amino-4-deoxy-L-arabinose transferase-like glycosyltransferase